MTNEELHEAFIKAVDVATNTSIELPADVKLRFYAYYKHALEVEVGYYMPNDKIKLKDAFKINALFQVKRISKEEAKKKYIEMVKAYLNVDVLHQ